MAILEKTSPSMRDVSIMVSDVRSGVLSSYTSPTSAIARLRQISKEHADLVNFKQVCRMFANLHTNNAEIRHKVEAILDLLPPE